MDDFVRVGGLAAVSAALPRALRSLSDVRILLPGYRDVVEQFTHLQIVGHCAAHWRKCRPVRSGVAATKDGLPVYVLLCPQLYDRPGNPYGDEPAATGRTTTCASDDLPRPLPSWRQALWTRIGQRTWFTPTTGRPRSCRPTSPGTAVKIPSILTIHNLAYQGLFPKESLRRIGAPASSFHIDGLEFYDKLSFLKGGIVYASHLTTVSETYAREITTAELGCGLEGLLRRRSDAAQLTGILNGIDESWDPRVCAQLAQPFGAGDWEGKRANADYVRQQFGLAVSRGPIFGLVARLVHQKGVDLVLSAADEIIEAGGQIVVTGSGEPEIEQALVDAHRRRPDAIGVAIGFNDGQARRIFAGSDFTLMPSRFEPCGLSQMYAQRFGSLPIGHQTGGLAETIMDGETGFLFTQPSTESFLGGIRRAFSTFVAKDRLDFDAPQRDVAIVQLGHFGGLLRRALSQGGGSLASIGPCSIGTRRVSGITNQIITRPERRDAGEPGECDAAAELVADIAGQHGAERRADAGRGADDALRQIEMTAAERDVGDDQRHHDAEYRRGDAVEHLHRDQQIRIVSRSQTASRGSPARQSPAAAAAAVPIAAPCVRPRATPARRWPAAR